MRLPLRPCGGPVGAAALQLEARPDDTAAVLVAAACAALGASQLLPLLHHEGAIAPQHATLQELQIKDGDMLVECCDFSGAILDTPQAAELQQVQRRALWVVSGNGRVCPSGGCYKPCGRGHEVFYRLSCPGNVF
eukprot:SM000112S23979  [mRNA]  locus=s112:157710:158841:+ [translate_table: standard]